VMRGSTGVVAVTLAMECAIIRLRGAGIATLAVAALRILLRKRMMHELNTTVKGQAPSPAMI
jgi:hypothetical protein